MLDSPRVRARLGALLHVCAVLLDSAQADVDGRVPFLGRHVGLLDQGVVGAAQEGSHVLPGIHLRAHIGCCLLALRLCGQDVRCSGE